MNDKVGRKVPLSSPSQSARDLAKLLNELEKIGLCCSSFRRIARKDKWSFPGRKRLRAWWSGIRRGKCFEKAFEKQSIFFSNPSVSL